MKDKHFLLEDLHFTQRASDRMIDATLLCTSKGKKFGNWYRMRKTHEILSKYENPIWKVNRHAWITEECVEHLIKWILKYDFDMEAIKVELLKPFEEEEVEEKEEITTKVCCKCHEELPLEKFWKNKRKDDGLDIRCVDCYSEERKGDPKVISRSLEVYYKNREKCNKNKTEWNRKNKDKVNAANRRAYNKRKAVEEEKRKEEEEKAKVEVENLLNNMTLYNKENQPYNVVCRESDGYVDITNLCKAGGKRFKHWHELVKTKEFLKVLGEQLGKEIEEDKENEDQENENGRIPAAFLINYETGYGSKQRTWVHPRVAINIAQWISPSFDVQVSGWVHQLLVVGKVGITDQIQDDKIMDIQKDKLKLNRLLDEGNIDDALLVDNDLVQKIDKLENKNRELEYKYKESLRQNKKLSVYLERKRRIQYDKGKVVYVLRHIKCKDCYKVGIAHSLTDRVSTYNTSMPDDFTMVYYQHTFYNDLVEKMIKRKLIDYLYTLNKEWYYVEGGPDILIENIKTAIDFFD